jgi:hypothetical protein
VLGAQYARVVKLRSSQPSAPTAGHSRSGANVDSSRQARYVRELAPSVIVEAAKLGRAIPLELAPIHTERLMS